MANAIHVELNTLCLIILLFIEYQSIHNVNQQTSRVLFRHLIDGVIFALLLDIIWRLIDGRMFPGAIPLNYLVNVLFLSEGIALGGIWYLYVLESLEYTITRELTLKIMAPSCFFFILNVISCRTGWIFTISPENVYTHGPLFGLQLAGALGALFIPLIHILVRVLNKNRRPSHHVAFKLLGFYILPVAGMLFSLPFTGMPGTWTCASVSLVLLYIDSQDREIMRDGLTGLNNRKTLNPAFSDYIRQVSPERPLYLFMLDLDNFKTINDTLGHTEGDHALVNTARVLTRSAAGVQCIIVRYGGDEFLIMGFFSGDEEAHEFKQRISDNFKAFNEENQLPYTLAVSIGFSRYQPGQSFEDLAMASDAALYADKTLRKKASPVRHNHHFR